MDDPAAKDLTTTGTKANASFRTKSYLVGLWNVPPLIYESIVLSVSTLNSSRMIV